VAPSVHDTGPCMMGTILILYLQNYSGYLDFKSVLRLEYMPLIHTEILSGLLEMSIELPAEQEDMDRPSVPESSGVSDEPHGEIALLVILLFILQGVNSANVLISYSLASSVLCQSKNAKQMQ